MSCYAVATAQTRVAQEHLLTYLTPANLKAPLTAYLQNRFPDTSVHCIVWQEAIHWTIYQDTGRLTISIEGGQITVRDYGPDQAGAAALAAELAPVLAQIGAAYWQQYVAALLEPYAVAEAQATNDGALVLHLKL